MAESGVPVLFLVADTGGGHRSAARAVAEGLHRAYPGRFAPVLLDPLSGPRSGWLLRRIMRMYGPAIRRAPWVWRAAYRATDSRPAMRLLRRALLRLADGPVAAAMAALRPAAVVSFHPLATGAAAGVAEAARAGGSGPVGDQPRVPVVTVVTDLAAVHTAWCDGRADRVVVPSAAAAHRCHHRGCLSPAAPTSASRSPPASGAVHCHRPGGSGCAPPWDWTAGGFWWW